MTQSRNQDPPLELVEPELIYREEIRVWIESGTGNVAIGGREWQKFVASSVFED